MKLRTMLYFSGYEVKERVKKLLSVEIRELSYQTDWLTDK
jgi:hypothetical protein